MATTGRRYCGNIEYQVEGAPIDQGAVSLPGVPVDFGRRAPHGARRPGGTKGMVKAS